MTAPDRLIAAFRATVDSPELVWAELRAMLLLDMRMERDGAFELARWVSLRIRNDLDIIREMTLLVPKMQEPEPASVDPDKIAKYSTLLRRLARPLPPEVLSAIQAEGRSLAAELVSAGVGAGDRAVGFEAVTRLLETWKEVKLTLANAMTLMERIEQLPRIESAYYAHRMADWALDAAWSTDPVRRQEVLDIVSSGLAFTRILERPIVAPLTHPMTLLAPAGTCESAQVRGANSGPFCTSATVFRLRAFTETDTDLIELQPRPVVYADFPLTHPDGYYYLPNVPPAVYSCGLAANLLPGAAVTVVTEYAYGGSRISATDLRDALIAAAIPGLIHTVEAGPGGSVLVRITAASPVTGPWGWFRFHSFSDPWMEPFFPGLVRTDDLSTSSDLAVTLTSRSKYSRYVVENHVLAEGEFAYPCVPDFDCVSLVKLYGNFTASGRYVTPDVGVTNSVIPGDTCILYDGVKTELCLIVGVESTRIELEFEPGILVGQFSVSPGLQPVFGTGMVIELEGRWYRFTAADLKVWSGIQYVDLTDRGPWDFFSGSPMPCRIEQQVMIASTRDETTSGWIRMDLANAPLCTEIGFSPVQAYNLAREWDADVTEVEGFRSQVRTNDAFLPLGGDPKTDSIRIEAVRNNTVVLARPMSAQFVPPGSLINVVRSSWEALLAVKAPELDIDLVEKLVQQYRVSGNQDLIVQLESVLQTLVAQFPPVEEAIDQFEDKPNGPATRSILRALERLGFGNVVDQLKSGDLTGLIAPARSVTRAGSAATETGLIADQFIMQLNAVERLLLGMDD